MDSDGRRGGLDAQQGIAADAVDNVLPRGVGACTGGDPLRLPRTTANRLPRWSTHGVAASRLQHIIRDPLIGCQIRTLGGSATVPVVDGLGIVRTLGRCALIGHEVLTAGASPEAGLVIEFALGTIVTNPESHELAGPEIAMLQLHEGPFQEAAWDVWRPAEDVFAGRDWP